MLIFINPLSASFTKWSNILKQFVGNLPTNCLIVFDHIVGLALKVLNHFTLMIVFVVSGFQFSAVFAAAILQRIEINAFMHNVAKCSIIL